MLTFDRDLSTMTYILSNAKYDFYIHKVGDKSPLWYTEALLRGTNKSATQAGFKTRKQAKACALTWAGWMK